MTQLLGVCPISAGDLRQIFILIPLIIFKEQNRLSKLESLEVLEQGVPPTNRSEYINKR